MDTNGCLKQDEEWRVMGQVISHPAEKEGSRERAREGSN